MKLFFGKVEAAKSIEGKVLAAQTASLFVAYTFLSVLHTVILHSRSRLGVQDFNILNETIL